MRNAPLGFTMGRETKWAAAACWVPGAGAGAVAGLCPAAPLSPLCPRSEFKSNQWGFIFLGIFLVIKKDGKFIYT